MIGWPAESHIRLWGYMQADLSPHWMQFLLGFVVCRLCVGLCVYAFYLIFISISLCLFLVYIPKWFSGNNWSRQGKVCKRLTISNVSQLCKVWTRRNMLLLLLVQYLPGVFRPIVAQMSSDFSVSLFHYPTFTGHNIWVVQCLLWGIYGFAGSHAILNT